MKYAELRRLAIRLARHTDREGDSYCGGCDVVDYHDGSARHTPNCPIAELEAEEAASVKLSIGGVEFETVPVPAWKAEVTIASGDDWEVRLTGKWETVSFDLKDGTTKTGWVRTMPTPEKPATKFEGEY